MKKIIVLTISIVSFLCSAHAIGVSDGLKCFIEELESQQSDIQGSAIAILVKDEVVYKKTFGYAKEQNDKIHEDTLFGLASLSKPISVLAMGLMVDQGLLKFDQKVKLPYVKYEVTLSNILSHTTGYKFSGDAETEKRLSRYELLDVVSRQEPECLPGRCYTYSNIMFSLIEEALSAQGLNFNNLIINLAQKLGTDSIKLLPLQNDSIAYPHSKKKLLTFPSPYQQNVQSSAGVFASLNGMIEFYKLSFGYRPDLISQQTLDQIYKPIIINSDILRWHTSKWPINFPFEINKVKSYYGLGWRILAVDDNPQWDFIYHAGYINGVKTFIGYVPYKKVGIIILSNDQDAAPAKSATSFWLEAMTNCIE